MKKLNRIGKFFIGLTIMCLSLFPIIVTGAFFAGGCNVQEWGALFTDLDGLVAVTIGLVCVVFLALCIYGFRLMMSAAETTPEEMMIDIMKAVKETREAEQAKCTHDTCHQVGFTNLLKCDECGMTFKNPHFVSDN